MPFVSDGNFDWSKVKITFIDHDTVTIETPCDKARYSYHELGMGNKRNGAHKLEWLRRSARQRAAKHAGLI